MKLANSCTKNCSFSRFFSIFVSVKEKIRLIMLRTTRYSDRHDIATALSRSAGAVSFFVSASAGRKTAGQRALMMPMNIIEGELSMKPGRTIGTLSDASASMSLISLYANPVKSSVAMFMADMLLAVAREGQAEPLIWDYVALSVETLASLPSRALANFPIIFLMGLIKMLGIAPDDGNYRRGMMLDLRDGIYRVTMPPHTDVATPEESRIIVMASRLSYRHTCRLRLSRDDRARLLDGILRYISIHHAKVDALRSLPILRSLFD